jgi:hypothetical protein
MPFLGVIRFLMNSFLFLRERGLDSNPSKLNLLGVVLGVLRIERIELSLYRNLLNEQQKF